MDLLTIANYSGFIASFSFILCLAIAFFFDDGKIESIMKKGSITIFVISFVVFGISCVSNYL